MKRATLFAVIFLIATLIAPSALLAKTHRVEFLNTAVINGVELEPGKYKVEINGENMAEIYDGKELLTKVKVEIQPIGRSTPNSISQKADGTVTEIRLKDEKVVLIES